MPKPRLVPPAMVPPAMPSGVLSHIANDQWVMMTTQWVMMTTRNTILTAKSLSCEPGDSTTLRTSVHSDVAFWSFDVGSSYHWVEDFEARFTPALESVQSQCILDDVARSQGPGEDMDPISLIVPRELAEILSQPVAVEKLREAIGDRSCSEDEDLGNKVSLLWWSCSEVEDLGNKVRMRTYERAWSDCVKFPMSVLGPSRFLHGKRILFFLVSDSQAGQGKPSWCRKPFKKRNVHTCKINRNAVSLCYILCCAPAGASHREWAAGDLLVASGFDWAARHRKSQQKKARRPNRSRRPRRMKRKPKPVQLRINSQSPKRREEAKAQSVETAPTIVHKNSRAQDQELQHLEEFTIEELQEKVHSTLAEILDHPPVEENPKATAIQAAECRQLFLHGTTWLTIIRGPRRERCLFKEWCESCE